MNEASAFEQKSRNTEKLHFAKLREKFETINCEIDEDAEAGVKEETSVEFETTGGDIDMEEESLIKEESSWTDAMESEGEEETKPIFKLEVSKRKSRKITVKKFEKTSPQQFQCPTCLKFLSTLATLRQHIKGMHENNRQHRCSQCPKAFLFRNQLNMHITHCHTFANDDTLNSLRPFKCESCGKFYKTKYDLKQHQKIHSGNPISF